MTEQVASPLTGKPAELCFELSTNQICDLYQTEYSTDVRPYLGNAPTLKCYRCKDTGFEFFAPGTLAGPPEFYSELYGSRSHVDWAYQGEKWDYPAAGRFVPPGACVLDIGCGGGDFLATLDASCARTGLEPSAFGQELAKQKGLKILSDPIDVHAVSHPEHYDVVTSLQVLEHIPDPHAFLVAALKTLRPNGTLVIAVPNNDAFLGKETLALNAPPHHMGRWTRQSLEALAPLFKLDLLSIEYEPITDLVGWYQSAMERRYFTKSRLMRTLWYRFGFSKAFADYMRDAQATIQGHTILAAYKKPA